MRRRLVDRRRRPRFEIMGQLCGFLEVVVRARVYNAGLNGTLLESSVPLPVRSVQRLALDIDGERSIVNMRVCHIRSVPTRDRESVYHVGVEFLSEVPSSLTGDIAERLRRDRTRSEALGECDMARDGIADRRRGPRITLGDSPQCELVIRARVNLLDVSTTGTLVSSDTPLPVGGRGELTALLPSGRFATALEVRRAHPGGLMRASEFGTMFKTMDAASQRALAAFTRTAME